MKMTKRVGMTDWYPPNIKPVRVGRYHSALSPCKPDAMQRRTWWDGTVWRWNNDSKPNWRLAYGSNPACMYQDRYWRGLTERAE